MWRLSITFSILLAPLARNHLGNWSGQNLFLWTIYLYVGTFIVVSEVVTNITCCEIKINALLRRWQIILGNMEIYIISKGARSLANYNDECIWYGMPKAQCYRLAPLLFGGNHILVIFAQNISTRNCFFGLQMQNFPCPGRGDRPSPRSVTTLPHSLLSETWKYRSFSEAVARWLLRWMYQKWYTQSSMLSPCPLGIWRESYSSNLCPKYASETVFSDSKCKIFLPRSSPRRSAHSDFRPPHPQFFSLFSSYGPEGGGGCVEALESEPPPPPQVWEEGQHLILYLCYHCLVVSNISKLQHNDIE